MKVGKQYVAQFWAGMFDTQARFNEFVGEDPEYWSEENADTPAIPLSAFIASQGRTWYDHDAMEFGFNNLEGSVLEKFESYSYASQWADTVQNELHAAGLTEANAFIMLGIEQLGNGEAYAQVDTPKSVRQEGVELLYIGEISYIHPHR